MDNLTRMFNLTEISLSDWETGDIQSLVKYGNNPNIFNMLTDRFPSPYTIKDAEHFIQMARSKQPALIKSIRYKGDAIGAVGLHPQEDVFAKNAELGYWIAEPFWSKGIMSHILPLMLRYSFENFEINRIFARPFSSNPSSQRVLQKSGFVKEAELKQTIYKNGKYLDELIFAFRRDDLE